MAVRANHSAPPPSSGSGADKLVGRGIAVLLLIVPIGVWLVVSNMTRGAPTEPSVSTGTLNPQTIFDDGSSRFLPTPVAAFPAEVETQIRPGTAADEQTAAAADVVSERSRSPTPAGWARSTRRSAQRPPGGGLAGRYATAGARAPHRRRRHRMAQSQNARRRGRLGLLAPRRRVELAQTSCHSEKGRRPCASHELRILRLRFGLRSG